MFDDDVPQHPEEEGKYTPEQVIRKDFDLLWETIITLCDESPYDVWMDLVDEVINVRLRLYERAGLLRAPE